MSLSLGSSDLRKEFECFVDSKSSYLGQRLILLLDKHNNINHRRRCVIIVAKLHVYLHGPIFMRDDLVDCYFHVSSLILRHSSGHALKKLFRDGRPLRSTAAGTRARSAVGIGEIVDMPACGLSLMTNIAGLIGFVGVWPEEFPVRRRVENIPTAEHRMCD